MDFHRAEELLVTAGDDDTIKSYNTLTGEPIKTVLSKKYGCANICFTHDPSSVIYTSTKVGFCTYFLITLAYFCTTMLAATVPASQTLKKLFHSDCYHVDRLQYLCLVPEMRMHLL